MKMSVLTYRAIIEQDGKKYHGYVPVLPGCHTQGKTIDDTRKKLKEAIEGWILSRNELGWDVPQSVFLQA